MDAEELYNQLKPHIEELLNIPELSEEGDEALADLCRKLAGVEESLDDDRGQYAYWQCYNRTGNNRMEAAFQRLVAGLRSGGITRLTLPDAINREMKEIGSGHTYGHEDTEPQVELARRLNPVLDELGFKPIQRWEW